MYTTITGVKGLNPGTTRWEIKDTSRVPRDAIADCRYDKKWLRIPVDGDTKVELDAIIHEVIHAAAIYLDEVIVEALATDITKVVWKLNWRKQYEKETE